MGAKTGIAWTDSTWSPLRARIKTDALEIASAKGYTSLVQILTATKPSGELRSPPGKVGHHCEHASPGCELCYSETNNGRCLPANGTGLPFDRRSRDLTDMFLDDGIMEWPLRWKRPRRIFVESQSDLFGEFVPDSLIDEVFATISLCPHHAFQVLTKRARRMLEYMTGGWQRRVGTVLTGRAKKGEITPMQLSDALVTLAFGTLPHVWLGVSCEDQQRADERIPLLLQTPAAVRWASYEPALGPINFSRYIPGRVNPNWTGRADDSPRSEWGLDWIVIGGESGAGARPMDIGWARATLKQCRVTRTPVFVKQLGADPREGNANGSCRDMDCTHPDCGWIRHRFSDRKGGEFAEWPADLRVRMFPEVRA